MPVASWEIASVFSIEDAATSILTEIAENAAKVGEAADAAQASLKSLGETSFGEVMAGLKAMQDELGGVATAAKGTAAATNAAMAAAGTSVVALTGQIRAMGQAYGDALRQLEQFRTAASQPFSIAGPGGGGGAVAPYWYQGEALPPGGGVSEPYRINGPNIIEHEAASGGAYLGSTAGAYALGYEGGGGAGGAIVSTGRAGWGTSGRQYGPYGGNAGRGAMPGQGGFPNWHAGLGDGPAISVGDGSYYGSRPGSVPNIPPWPAFGGGGGRGGDDEEDEGGGGAGRRGRLNLGVTQLVEGAAVAYAMHEGMSEEAAISRAMIRGFHMNPADPANADIVAKLRRSAHDAAQGTSFTEAEVAGGMATLAAPMMMRGREGVDQFAPVFEVAAKAAEAAKQLGIGTFEGTLGASVEYAHQTNSLQAKQLAPRLNDLFAITESLPDSTVSEQARVMSYIVPEATAMGIDPHEMAQAAGFLELSGLRGTKAATTLRQLLLGTLKTGGPMNAHMERAGNALERALKLGPDERAEVEHASHGSAHAEALRDLGLIDLQGRPTFLTSAGAPSPDKIFADLTAAATRPGMTPAHFAMDMYNLAGVRGEDANMIAQRSDTFARFRRYTDPLSVSNPMGTIPAAQQLAQISGTTQQESGQAVARFSDVLNYAATSVLPEFNAALRGVVAALTGIERAENAHPYATAGATVLGVGAAANSLIEGGLGYFATGKAIGGLKGAWHGLTFSRLRGRLGRGAEAGAEDAAELAAAPEEAAAGGGLLALLGGLAVPSAVGAGAAATGAGLGYAAHRVDQNVPTLRRLDNWTERELLPVRNVIQRLASLVGSSPAAPITAAAAPGAPVQPGQVPTTVTNQVHVAIGPVTFNGVASDIESMGAAMLHGVADALGRALSHNTGATGGVHLDPTAIPAHG